MYTKASNLRLKKMMRGEYLANEIRKKSLRLSAIKAFTSPYGNCNIKRPLWYSQLSKVAKLLKLTIIAIKYPISFANSPYLFTISVNSFL